MRMSTSASASAGPATAPCSVLAAAFCTRSPPPTITLIPHSQRRIARNAELVFWSNLPARHLAAAIVPHAALLVTQGVWRLSRLRFIPFFLGKIDAVRMAPVSIHARRKLRADLARSSIAPAHFPLKLGSFRDVLNHLRRPREHSARKHAQ